MDITIIDFLILIGASFRLTSLFLAQQYSEAGPWDILDRFRFMIGIRYSEQSMPYGLNMFAKMLTCVYCLSFWVGVAVAVAYLIVPWLTIYVCLPLALSTGAILVKRYVSN